MLNYLKSLIGRKILSLRSSKIGVTYFNDELEIFLDYTCVLIAAYDSKNCSVFKVESNWYELDNGGDNLEIAFGQEEIIHHLFGWPNSNFFQSFPSSVGGFPFDFTIQKIEVFGFNVNYNLEIPTKHILLFLNQKGDKVLLKPEPFGIGLSLTWSASKIETFFNNDANSSLIFKVVEIDNQV